MEVDSMAAQKPLKQTTPVKVVKVRTHARLQPPAFQPIATAQAEANAIRVAGAGGRQNLYVAAKDQEVWNRAEKLAEPESLSSLVTRLLRRYVNQLDLARNRIVVDIEDDDQRSVRKAFKGRYLVSEFKSESARGALYAAQGAKGGIAVWWERSEGDAAKTFITYEDFDELAAGDENEWPGDFISAVSAALGEDYAEEIDL
jgi:hypothetical protein